MSNLSNVHTCGLTEILLFLLAIVFGTGCSICSKTMMSLRGTNGFINVETGECFHLSNIISLAMLGLMFPHIFFIFSYFVRT